MAISQKLKDAIKATADRIVSKSFVWVNRVTITGDDRKYESISESEWDNIKSDASDNVFYNIWFKCTKESDMESANAELNETIGKLSKMGLSLSDKPEHRYNTKDGSGFSKLIVGRDLNRS